MKNKNIATFLKDFIIKGLCGKFFFKILAIFIFILFFIFILIFILIFDFSLYSLDYLVILTIGPEELEKLKELELTQLLKDGQDNQEVIDKFSNEQPLLEQLEPLEEKNSTWWEDYYLKEILLGLVGVGLVVVLVGAYFWSTGNPPITPITPIEPISSIEVKDVIDVINPVKNNTIALPIENSIDKSAENALKYSALMAATAAAWWVCEQSPEIINTSANADLVVLKELITFFNEYFKLQDIITFCNDKNSLMRIILPNTISIGEGEYKTFAYLPMELSQFLLELHAYFSSFDNEDALVQNSKRLEYISEVIEDMDLNTYLTLINYCDFKLSYFKYKLEAIPGGYSQEALELWLKQTRNVLRLKLFITENYQSNAVSIEIIGNSEKNWRIERLWNLYDSKKISKITEMWEPIIFPNEVEVFYNKQTKLTSIFKACPHFQSDVIDCFFLFCKHNNLTSNDINEKIFSSFFMETGLKCSIKNDYKELLLGCDYRIATTKAEVNSYIFKDKSSEVFTMEILEATKKKLRIDEETINLYLKIKEIIKNSKK